MVTITTFTSRDFTRNLAAAKKAADQGPVFVTHRGRPTYALLKIEDYDQLAGTQPQSLLAVLDAIPGGAFKFEPPRLSDNGLKPADLG